MNKFDKLIDLSIDALKPFNVKSLDAFWIDKLNI
jgi:hypothetical protein